MYVFVRPEAVGACPNSPHACRQTATPLLAAAAKHADVLAGRALYLANSSQPEIAALTQRLAAVLDMHAPADARWHHQPMPEETHATIYHPAALRAFRQMFAPEAPQR